MFVYFTYFVCVCTCAAAAKASTPTRTPSQTPSVSKTDLTDEVAVDIEGETKAEAALDVRKR